ncbi:MAG: dTDP-4-dehydrorhamnose reductase [Verrucomicrobia bacterium]|nr:MAG: dTDP-4-dehydrorhamnose reductase [Verrucomicrobiota bacterium]
MKIILTGAGGRLGAALVREYREKFEVTGFDHAQLDLANLDRVRDRLGATEFDVLINAAAFTNVDLCEKEPEQAFRINAEAPRVLAEICRDKNAKLIHFSTDYVFDGEKGEPYVEEDEARPISVYGQSKSEGEEKVLAMHDRHLVVRVSWVFGPDRPSFVDAMIKRAREEEHIEAIADKFSAPTYTGDIAKMLPRFFDVEGGILHFANAGECTWQEYAQFGLDCCRSLGIRLKAKAVGAIKLKEMKNWVARRPVYSVLSTAKYIALTGTTPRNWRDAVGEYLKDFYFPK